MHLRNLIISLLFLLRLPVLGQTDLRSQNPTYLTGNYSVVNPAHAGVNASTEVFSFYQGHTGLQKIFKTIDLGFYHRLSNDKIHIGLMARSDIEEEFSNLTSVSGLFTYRLFQTKTSGLQAGGTFGIVNYHLLGNEYISGLSDWGAIGSFGLWYNYKKWEIGASLNNLFNTSLVPFQTEIRMPRHLSGILQYSTELSPRIDWRTSIRSLVYFGDIPHRFIWSNELSYLEQFSFSVLVDQAFQLNFGAQVRKLPVHTGELAIGFLFGLPLVKNEYLPLSANNYELTLSYQFKEKDKSSNSR